MASQSVVANNICKSNTQPINLFCALFSGRSRTVKGNSFMYRTSQQRPPSELAHPITNLDGRKQVMLGRETGPQAINVSHLNRLILGILQNCMLVRVGIHNHQNIQTTAIAWKRFEIFPESGPTRESIPDQNAIRVSDCTLAVLPLLITRC